MAGISVTVCLPPLTADDDVETVLVSVLAPFEMDSDNPHDREMWDAWRIRGDFAVAPGHWDDPRLIHEMPNFDGTPRPIVPGFCAGGPRGLLDLTLSQRKPEILILTEVDSTHREVTLPRLHGHVLTLDGWWFEPRGQVVHGACDPMYCTHTPPDIGLETEDYLATLPDDIVLVRLHCHG
jgi:hypothetical protein